MSGILKWSTNFITYKERNCLFLNWLEIKWSFLFVRSFSAIISCMPFVLILSHSFFLFIVFGFYFVPLRPFLLVRISYLFFVVSFFCILFSHAFYLICYFLFVYYSFILPCSIFSGVLFYSFFSFALSHLFLRIRFSLFILSSSS